MTDPTEADFELQGWSLLQSSNKILPELKSKPSHRTPSNRPVRRSPEIFFLYLRLRLIFSGLA